MAGEGQDQEKLLFWECWLISLPSALTVLRNEITHDVHLAAPPSPSVLHMHTSWKPTIILIRVWGMLFFSLLPCCFDLLYCLDPLYFVFIHYRCLKLCNPCTLAIKTLSFCVLSYLSGVPTVTLLLFLLLFIYRSPVALLLSCSTAGKGRY